MDGVENEATWKLGYTLEAGLESEVNCLPQNSDRKSSHRYRNQDYKGHLDREVGWKNLSSAELP